MRIRKLLIANRGEIAVRISNACRSLGIQSIAVYSDIDRDSVFVRQADYAFHLGPSEARHSYLDAARIVDLAKKSGADAVHPGYGFLAENAEFAESCRAAGLVFVGPSPDIIAQMGSKIAAKEAAIKAGVPVVPGFQKDGASDADLTEAAQKIGFPLMIKASAGGGGRGMRIVSDASDLKSELSLARQEAKSAFGDDAVLLEKYLPVSRHIEVQIIADRHGNTRHAFERDCSVQRNHQKILEEAPAPDLSEAERSAILSDAVNLAAGIGYDSVGTVEFIFDPEERKHYFLEMNTRLQVEHPVTECVTGLDLAALQIRLAAGEVVPFTQEEIACVGWAIEARVAAEDASQGYRPATGVVTGYQEPSGSGIRVDSGIQTGSTVSHFYDSMLAKLIACGADRDTARRRLHTALQDFQIDGVETNVDFLADVLQADAFTLGSYDTRCLLNLWPEGWRKPTATDQDFAEAGLIRLLALNEEAHPSPPSPWAALGAWRIGERGGAQGSSYFYTSCGKILQITGNDSAYTVSVNDLEVLSTVNTQLRNGTLRYEVGGESRTRAAVLSGDSVALKTRRGMIEVTLSLAENVLLNNAAAGDENGLTAGMPGQVVEVCVTTGDRVTAGQKLVVLEAMKLLQPLTAPNAGTVAEIHYKAGDSVEGGAVLVSIEADS